MTSRVNFVMLLVAATLAVAVGFSGIARADNLAAYYPMDDNAATPTLTDAATGAYSATFATAAGVATNTDTYSVPGMFGTAINFSSTYQGQVANPQTLMAGLNSFTVSFWEQGHSGTTNVNLGYNAALCFGGNTSTGSSRIQLELGPNSSASGHSTGVDNFEDTHTSP